jgi:dihydrofolate synthase/folylpolyglutamate synthase
MRTRLWICIHTAGFLLVSVSNLKSNTKRNAEYEKCLSEMFALRRFGIILGLETIKRIMESIGNPQERFASVHIAGTNGKGSIASFLAAVLRASGYHVGLYTSPHLVRFNERIKVDDKEISNQDVLESYKAVKRADYGDREPTFFEYTTAMAFYYFGRCDVDWAIVETGMGGRMDATNILNPAVSVISSLSLEHQMYLGRTLSQISAEKGGIIKNNTPVVTGVRQKKPLAVLRSIADSKSAPLYRLGEDFMVRRLKGNRFSYFGLDHTWRALRIGLKGAYQTENAAVVLAVCELLMKGSKRFPALNIPLRSIRDGLEKNRWPGRLEQIQTEPLVILDGAHNPSAVRNLSKYMAEHLSGRRITLVTGILDDKSYESMLRKLLPNCSRVILTQSKIDRSLDPEKLYPIARKMVSDVTIIRNVEKAVQHALQTVSRDEAVCIAGSLYVVGEARAFFEKAGMV